MDSDFSDDDLFPYPFLSFVDSKSSNNNLFHPNLSLANPNATPPKKPEISLIKLSSDLSSLLSSEDFSDLVIKTPTGDIKAHKTILAARSPVFHSMLKSPMVENMESRIEIPDFSFEIVKEMLNFIYSGTLSLDDKNIETLSELFKISHKYQFDDLRKNCSEIMGSKLDLNNVGEIFIISSLYDEANLKTKALLFIKTNMKKLVANEEFKKLKKSHPQIMADILFALYEN